MSYFAEHGAFIVSNYVNILFNNYCFVISKVQFSKYIFKVVFESLLRLKLIDGIEILFYFVHNCIIETGLKVFYLFISCNKIYKYQFNLTKLHDEFLNEFFKV